MNISVIIPAYNREEYIGEAIESVLTQTYPPYEVIVVDNNSTDRTVEIAASFAGVSVVHESKQSIGAARNRGVLASSGDWLSFLDSDDLWTQEKLALQVAELERHAEVSICFGMSQNFADPTTSPDALPVAAINTRPIAGRTVSTLLIHRPVFEQIGLFAETTGSTEYVEWFSRLQDNGEPFVEVDQVLHLRRIHAQNTAPKHNQQYSQVLKQILDRRRKSQS
jgi:glycosyltransferase involved in cell wall biosynthesis